MSEHKLKKKYEEERQLIPDPSLSFYTSSLFRIAMVFVIIIIISCFVFFKYHSKHQASITTTSYSSVYASVNNRFFINFPGRPNTSSASTIIYKASVPYTSYSLQNNSKLYIVRVYNLKSAVNLSYYNSTQIQNFLSTWLNAVATGTSNWHLNTSKFFTFDGQKNTLSAFLTGNNNQNSNIYFYSFIKGELMYNIITDGLQQSDSNSFINSFKFVNK